MQGRAVLGMAVLGTPVLDRAVPGTPVSGTQVVEDMPTVEDKWSVLRSSLVDRIQGCNPGYPDMNQECTQDTLHQYVWLGYQFVSQHYKREEVLVLTWRKGLVLLQGR